jgi:mannose-1-phosphate guanylyltransferase
MLYSIIIAGGSGKRLWPRSKIKNPKSFLKINSSKALLEQAVDRACRIMPIENVIVMASSQYSSLVRKTLPGLPARNIIPEPVSRNTGPAICLGAALIKQKDPNAIVYIMPADQVIEKESVITEVFLLCSVISRIKDSIVTIGIKPGFASTGYGYIKTARLYKSLSADVKYDVFKVDRFIEKPDKQRAKRFYKTKTYLWNSGIFIARPDVLLNEFKVHKPEVYRIALKIANSKGFPGLKKSLKQLYKTFPDISFDYAIMEKTNKAFSVKADPGWSDIGSWDMFWKYLNIDKHGNAIKARHIGVETDNSIVIGDDNRLIATLGIKGLIVVQSGDSTLICAKNKSGNMKGLVAAIEGAGLKRYL